MSGPDDVVWYISRDGQRIGPLTTEEFAQFEETGRLRPTDQIWHTGIPAWIAYRDYDMRAAAIRFASSARPSSSTSRLHAISNKVKEALRSVSKRMADIRTVRTRSGEEDAQAPVAPEAKPTSSFADLQEMIPASPRGAQGPSLPLLPEKLAPRRPEDIPQQSQQDRNRNVPAEIIEHVAEPSLRSSPIPRLVREPDDAGLRRLATGLLRPAAAETPQPREPRKQDQDRRVPADTTDEISAHIAEPIDRSLPVPRLASEVQAAGLIGLDLTTFRRWVADGRLPRVLPDCGKYDLKAIHLALDRMSNIASPANGPHERLHRNND